MPYTMFASAVFFAPERHEDCEYRLDPIHIYRCQNGFWECMRIHSSRQKSSKLGEMMRACDQRLRLALDPPSPKGGEGPPNIWPRSSMTRWWHGFRGTPRPPVEIDIDLSQLGHIRSAAAQTREALLIDEEREDDVSMEAEATLIEQPNTESAPSMTAGPGEMATRQDEPDEPTVSTEEFGVVAPLLVSVPAPVTPASADAANKLAPAADAFLRALLERNTAQATLAAAQSGRREDMLVDSIDEALFDLVGDTVIEFGAAGPQIIEDYEADVRGYLDHE